MPVDWYIRKFEKPSELIREFQYKIDRADPTAEDPSTNQHVYSQDDEGSPYKSG